MIAAATVESPQCHHRKRANVRRQALRSCAKNNHNPEGYTRKRWEKPDAPDIPSFPGISFPGISFPGTSFPGISFPACVGFAARTRLRFSRLYVSDVRRPCSAASARDSAANAPGIWQEPCGSRGGQRF